MADGIWCIIKKGLRCRCPQCGQGRLLRGYLAPEAKCSVCAENFEKLRADDGPAWLTILLTGHVIAPLFVEMVRHPILPEWATILVLMLLSLVLGGVLLPRCKGVFMALIWAQGQKK